MRRGRKDEAAEVGWPCPTSVQPAAASVGPHPQLLSLKVEVSSDKRRRHARRHSVEECLADPLRREIMGGLGAIRPSIDAIEANTRAASGEPEGSAGPFTAQVGQFRHGPVLNNDGDEVAAMPRSSG